MWLLLNRRCERRVTGKGFPIVARERHGFCHALPVPVHVCNITVTTSVTASATDVLIASSTIVISAVTTVVIATTTTIVAYFVTTVLVPAAISTVFVHATTTTVADPARIFCFAVLLSSLCMWRVYASVSFSRACAYPTLTSCLFPHSPHTLAPHLVFFSVTQSPPTRHPTPLAVFMFPHPWSPLPPPHPTPQPTPSTTLNNLYLFVCPPLRVLFFFFPPGCYLSISLCLSFSLYLYFSISLHLFSSPPAIPLHFKYLLSHTFGYGSHSHPPQLHHEEPFSFHPPPLPVCYLFISPFSLAPSLYLSDSLYTCFNVLLSSCLS